jgi:hypothetical protein
LHGAGNGCGFERDPEDDIIVAAAPVRLYALLCTCTSIQPKKRDRSR